MTKQNNQAGERTQLNKIRYEQATNTLRSYPGNHCICELANFSSGGATDAALGDIDQLGERIAAMFNSGISRQLSSFGDGRDKKHIASVLNKLWAGIRSAA